MRPGVKVVLMRWRDAPSRDRSLRFYKSRSFSSRHPWRLVRAVWWCRYALRDRCSWGLVVPRRNRDLQNDRSLPCVGDVA